MFKIAIVGSRDFEPLKLVSFFLDEFASFAKMRECLIISGGARGVDAAAVQFAQRHGIHCAVINALWGTNGKAAGIIRNEYIVELADVVVAFWDGKSPGTRNTIRLAEEYPRANRIVFPTSDEEYTRVLARAIRLGADV